MDPSSRSGAGFVELVAVGDLSLGDSSQAVGSGVHTMFERVRGQNGTYPFECVGSLFGGAGIVFGNLETVLSHSDLRRWSVSSMEMRGHPQAAERLARAGFTVLNVANNHVMQYGMSAFSETVQALRRHGLGVVGLASSDHRDTVPHVVSVNGVSVTFLGFAFERDKYAQGPVPYAFGPDCEIVRQVENAKKQTDVVVCSVHWGLEFVRHPSIEEEDLGRRLVDAGADLVLGHHPHVARRVERHGRGLIAYSLGNFVFDMLWSPWLRTGLVLRVRLSRHGIQDYKTELVWIGDDFQPCPVSGEKGTDARRAFDALHHRPEWVSSAKEYARQYEALVARNRRESYTYFLRTVNTRPVSYTVQTLLRTGWRKAVAALEPRTLHKVGSGTG